jgi:hypothetical protein
VDSYVDIITSSVVGLLDEFASRVYQELNYVQVGFDFCVRYPILLAIQKVGVFILK